MIVTGIETKQNSGKESASVGRRMGRKEMHRWNNNDSVLIFRLGGRLTFQFYYNAS